MGCHYSVKYYPHDRRQAPQLLKKKIDRLLLKINQEMSTFIPTSTLSRFNQTKTTNWVAVSPSLAYVVYYALYVATHTAGAYDPTILPLVDRFGFGAHFKLSSNYHLPSKEEIIKLKAQTGYLHLHANLWPPLLKKDLPSLQVDLSGIAKGYGVDQVGQLLLKEGLDQFIIEIGGEVKAFGGGLFGWGWRVGIAGPSSSSRPRSFFLRDRACATSGEYESYFIINEKKYSHTIDPRTGWPIPYHNKSITICHKSCMMADAWATAINVLNSTKALRSDQS